MLNRMKLNVVRDGCGSMNVILLVTLFALTAAETCIRFLKNPEERRIFQTIPGHIWRWNSFTEEFEEIQAVKLNGTIVCSVKMANDLRGRSIVVAADNMHPYILRNSNNTGVTGFMGDIWTTLEETLGFKYNYYISILNNYLLELRSLNLYIYQYDITHCVNLAVLNVVNQFTLFQMGQFLSKVEPSSGMDRVLVLRAFTVDHLASIKVLMCFFHLLRRFIHLNFTGPYEEFDQFSVYHPHPLDRYKYSTSRENGGGKGNQKIVAGWTIYQKAGPSASQTLMNGEAHALLLATVIYSDTSGYYAYSTPITTISYSLFVQSDGTEVLQQWYTNIFSRRLWLTILIFIFVTVATILGVHYLKKMMQANYVENDYEFSSASFNLLVVLGSLCGQGCEKVPASWPLRLIVLCHLITGLLLSGGFSSTLTSYLAIRGSSFPLTSLEDALQKRSHSVCVRNDSRAYIHFTESVFIHLFQNGSPRGDVRKEWKNLVNINCPDMKNSSTLRTQLCKPGLAFLEVPDVFLPIYQHVKHTCNIIQTPNHYWNLRISFLHSRFAQHRHIIDTYLMRFHSAGILKYLERKWMPKGIQSSKIQQSPFQPVEYAHIHLLFLGLISMAIISAFICVLENVWYKLQVTKQSSKFDNSDESRVSEKFNKFFQNTATKP
ncbi:uncharacterized protein LOC143179596 [Calliopsis andreniformis]|uniref:uncharacterized protein LOC143179596 n=1 Tax=Calliopsis andreniformis TaxID=337506 RepID=UPI003FCEAA43